MSNQFIIGGGISGLIFAHYNPEFKIISPVIDGQFNTTAPWLHLTEETLSLVTDLGLPFSYKKAHIA